VAGRPPLGWLVSPRPAGLGFPPCGRRLSDNGSYPFLESVESLVCPIAAVARLTSLGEAGRPPSGPSRPLTLPRFCSALMHSPGKWVLEILVTLGCLVNLWMDVEAFRCIQLNKGLTLDSELHECVTLPLVQIRDYVLGGARPASLGEAGQPGFLPFSVHFGTPVPRIKTHPKLVELIRNKQNMNET